MNSRFTDEDLEDAKIAAELGGVLNASAMLRIISRLEAAEALIALSSECECEGSAEVCKWFEARDTWRKAAGK